MANTFIQYVLTSPELNWAFSEGVNKIRYFDIDIESRFCNAPINKKVALVVYCAAQFNEMGALYADEGRTVRQQFVKYIRDDSINISQEYSDEFMRNVVLFLNNEMFLLILCSQLSDYPFSNDWVCRGTEIYLARAEVLFNNTATKLGVQVHIGYAEENGLAAYSPDRSADTLVVSAKRVFLNTTAQNLPTTIEKLLATIQA